MTATRAPSSMTTSIVLAGGKSSRMGEPKALLPFDGEPLIRHIVGMLRQHFDEVLVVAASGQALPAMPARVVYDGVAHQGPVGGIYYGLQAAEGNVCFVTSCDSAFLNPNLIAYLLAAARGYDVVVPHWDGRFQPLHAVYRKGVLPFLDGQLARGELRPVSLFERVRTRRVDEHEIRLHDPEGLCFFNMNTPEDYARALEYWRLRHGSSCRDVETQHAAIGCTIELFGVARLLARTATVSLTLPPAATVAHVLEALAERLPILLGPVIETDRRSLVDGHTCNVNGLQFVRDTGVSVHHGDSIVILSADAGG
jgi:molybdopterin-guanine dinucleotide biosynthesis protein A